MKRAFCWPSTGRRTQQCCMAHAERCSYRQCRSGAGGKRGGLSSRRKGTARA